nr:MAG TPA: hypothetical protein [Caudoviricetes sp.]
MPSPGSNFFGSGVISSTRQSIMNTTKPIAIKGCSIAALKKRPMAQKKPSTSPILSSNTIVS